jgi:hypothetical protein
MCTVLLRYSPGAAWPLLLAAVRDEFLERPWDPPAAHWPAAPDLVGGRDRTAGGTWLAVRADPPAVAALLNGVRLPPLESGPRPTRGSLVLGALRGEDLPDLTDYDGFHLLLGTPTSVTVWSWDGLSLMTREMEPGDHIIVNLGVDASDDPLVPHFAPLLAKTDDPPLTGDSTVDAWDAWVELLRGDGLPGDDPRALIVRREFDGLVYGSGSASLVAIAADQVRYDFTATPADPRWFPVLST